MRKLILNLFYLVLFVSFEVLANSSKFCWYDKEKNIFYYSDRPRPNISDEQIMKDQEKCKNKESLRDGQRPNSNDEKPSDENSTVSLPSLNSENNSTVYNEEQRKIEAAFQKEEAVRQEENKKYCTDLRSYLAQLRNVSRLTVTEPSGETRKIDEPERQARIMQAEQDISSNCN